MVAVDMRTPPAGMIGQDVTRIKQLQPGDLGNETRHATTDNHRVVEAAIGLLPFEHGSGGIAFLTGRFGDRNLCSRQM